MKALIIAALAFSAVTAQAAVRLETAKLPGWAEQCAEMGAGQYAVILKERGVPVEKVYFHCATGELIAGVNVYIG
jgi:hypothetical protein